MGRGREGRSIVGPAAEGGQFDESHGLISRVAGRQVEIDEKSVGGVRLEVDYVSAFKEPRSMSEPTRFFHTVWRTCRLMCALGHFQNLDVSAAQIAVNALAHIRRRMGHMRGRMVLM